MYIAKQANIHNVVIIMVIAIIIKIHYFQSNSPKNLIIKQAEQLHLTTLPSIPVKKILLYSMCMCVCTIKLSKDSLLKSTKIQQGRETLEESFSFPFPLFFFEKKTRDGQSIRTA